MDENELNLKEEREHPLNAVIGITNGLILSGILWGLIVAIIWLIARLPGAV